MGKSLDELAAGTIDRGRLTPKGMDLALCLSASCTAYTARAYVKMWRRALAILTEQRKQGDAKPTGKAAAR